MVFLPLLKRKDKSKSLINIGVRAGGAGGAGGAAAPPVSKIFGQNAKNSGNKERINDGIEK